MSTLKKILLWTNNHIKLLILFITIAVLSVLVLWWGRKNKKIRELENQLAVLNAKLKIERLAIAYDATVAELVKLKEKDTKINAELVDIEISLKEKLEKNMTAEEIAAKFREIGLP